MAESAFSNPTQFQITSLTIDGQDVTGLFSSFSIYEDIYIPVITGQVVIMDSDSAKFIDEYKIEFIEPIEFTIKDAAGNSLEFKGVLNGLRNEWIEKSIKHYTIDFTSEAVRKNEQTFVVKSYKESRPEQIVSDMVEKLGSELNSEASGIKMQYIGSRKRPVDIIKYVLTHAVSTGKDKPEATDSGDSKEEEAKGTTGFLCWETFDEGHKFETIQKVLSGQAGEKHKDYKTLLANRNLPLDTLMKSIVQVEFTQIGDFQTKLRSGAFASTNISFDMDKGIYKEYKYYNRENMTKKQREALPEGEVTRFYSRVLDNQRFTNVCQIAQPNSGDQSRQYLVQNSGGQNTFSDQTGQITLYPQYHFHAGDTIDIKVAKVKDETSEGGYDEKHSGRYVIQQVAHHMFNNETSYTRIKTIRSTIQQDDSSSTKS